MQQEQELHTRSFVGREDVLARISAWIDGAPGGGYLLLLGPPGQGKSALMAELARRESATSGCMLHMIKSHRHPRRFVPALVAQAAKLAGTSFGPAAYQGDVDALRNALVRALGAVVEKRGRAVVVIDAIDEVEGDQRVAFLPASLPAGVRVVLTARPEISLVEALRARLSALEERSVPAFGAGDLPALQVARAAPARMWRVITPRRGSCSTSILPVCSGLRAPSTRASSCTCP